ncbi:MAG: diguanylate cyclase [Candidatus Omnitrophica bacterium]|nr:diguanylate cyclase [Candidatus Omnitrophota bacterium]
MNLFRKLTVVNRGLRYKLMIAFCLMSIIPLLSCVYIINIYLFPQLDNPLTVSIVVLVSIIVSLLGLFLAKSLIEPVIDMAIEAKLISGGDYDRRVAAPFEDEVGNLADSINFMTRKIKTNMDEIKSYGRKMGEVNQDIQEKVMALSSLLQIGDIIAAGSLQLDALLEIAVEKVSTVFENGFGILYMPKEEDGDFVAKTSCGMEKENLTGLVIRKDGTGILEKAVANRSVIVLDKSVKPSKDLADFKTASNIANAVIIPLYSSRRNLGLLIVGNRVADFRYKDEDTDMIRVFAKQIAIAIESDILSRRTSELSITDDLTNLYNKRFILNRLEEEIKRAIFYQRPCSFIVFSLDQFDLFRQSHGELAAEEALRRIAKAIRENMMPIGKAARISGFEFAVLLPEKNKREASYVAEEMKKMIEATNLIRDGKAAAKVTVGVSENPIDGATSDELFKRAEEAIRQAKGDSYAK